MSEVVLDVKNLSKSFQLRESNTETLKEAISNIFSNNRKNSQSFCALNDISFQLCEGEALGIIGENGAGKSTLLKILSGISYPDKGEINFYGKPVSILDIGAGFHPELSGRENVFLSAALYKFTKRDIEDKFQQIVDFSGIERFIDEPVKNYSSGMYLRLAFSIVTCLDADIYIIDEVINVGDANFQNKCKQRMEELIAAGKTLLIASHNLNEIVLLCNRIILMEKGEIIEMGGNDVIQKYMTRSLPQYFLFEDNEFFHLQDIEKSMGTTNEFELQNCGIRNYQSLPDGISCSHPFTVFVNVHLLRGFNFVIRLKFYDSTGVLVFVCSNSKVSPKINSVGQYLIDFEIPSNIFNERMYSMDIVFVNAESETVLKRLDKFLTIKMAVIDQKGNNDFKAHLQGVVRPRVGVSVAKS